MRSLCACHVFQFVKQEIKEGRAGHKGMGSEKMGRKCGILYFFFTSELACEHGFLRMGEIGIW